MRSWNDRAITQCHDEGVPDPRRRCLPAGERPVIVVDDPADARLVDYRRLNDVAFRRRYEAETGVLIAEGHTVVRRLLESGLEVRSVLCLHKSRDRLVSEPGVPVFVVDDETMRSVVGFDLHRGVVAAGVRPPPLEVADLIDARSLALIEGVNDHENLGAVMRAAAALGVGGIVLDPTTADPWYRRSVRVSMGGAFRVGLARSRDWGADLLRVREAGFGLVAMTPADDAHPIETVSVDRPAVLIGAEGPGLRRSTLEVAQVQCRIPMAAGLDSLNVAQAAAIAFDRLIRSRA